MDDGSRVMDDPERMNIFGPRVAHVGQVFVTLTAFAESQWLGPGIGVVPP